MSSGFLMPDPRLRELSDLGVIQAGAKLNTYVAGTPSTPLATYSDVALTVPNANPVVASAGGLFGPIYLTPGVSYKFVLTDSLGNALWTQDNVPTPGGVATVPQGGTGVATLTAHGVLIGEAAAAIAATAVGTTGQVLTGVTGADPTFQAPAIDNGVNDFRLSLSTGAPVTTADVLAATTVYAVPYKGNRIALFDGAGVATLVTSAQVSIALPAAANQVYDVFGYSNAGVFTLELLAWTNDTARATALTLATTGVYTKTADLTRRYLGTLRTTGVAGQCEDSAAKRYLWNYYHRIARQVQRLETTTNWTYNSATIRQANAAAANQVDVVVGVAEVLIDLHVQVSANAVTNTNAPVIGIGLDSTTVFAGNQTQVAVPVAGSGNNFAMAHYTAPVAVGRHFFAWLESVRSGETVNFYSNGATAIGGAITLGAGVWSGIVGWVEG